MQAFVVLLLAVSPVRILSNDRNAIGLEWPPQVTVVFCFFKKKLARCP